MLVLVIVELFVSRDFDSDEISFSSVSDWISVAVEYFGRIVPFVKLFLGTEPAKIIVVCYDDHWFLRGCLLEEELEVP